MLGSKNAVNPNSKLRSKTHRTHILQQLHQLLVSTSPMRFLQITPPVIDLQQALPTPLNKIEDLAES